MVDLPTPPLADATTMECLIPSILSPLEYDLKPPSLFTIKNVKNQTLGCWCGKISFSASVREEVSVNTELK